MSEQIIVAIIGVVGTVIGAVIGGFIQKGTAPLHSRWLIAIGAGGGLLIGLIAGFVVARNTPSSSQFGIGSIAPNFALADTKGNIVTLDNLLAEKDSVTLVFYKGHW